MFKQDTKFTVSNDINRCFFAKNAWGFSYNHQLLFFNSIYNKVLDEWESPIITTCQNF
jgi:hypothetical protein